MTMNRRTALVGVAAGLPALTLSAARAQTQPAPGSGLDAYVQQTLLLGNLAMLASQLAAKKASDENVRQFANLEISEQQAIAGVLQSTPAGKAEPEIPPDRKKALDQLGAIATGREFDLAYVEAQIKGHNELLAVQQSASGNREASVEAVTARLAEQGVNSHIAMLGLIQQMLASKEIQNIQDGKNPDGTTTPTTNPAATP